MVDQIRMHFRAFLIGALFGTAIACARKGTPASDTATTPDHLMTAQELMAIPHGNADHRIMYGSDSSEYGELRVPDALRPRHSTYTSD